MQVFRKYERGILVASLADTASPEHGFSGGSDWFLSARELLSASAREFLNAPSTATASGEDISGPAQTPYSLGARRTKAAPYGPACPAGSLEEIDDPILVRTLEIIDDHFGQYDEVYLTPLLRKLSDLVDERRYDPKNLISDLEEQQAVRLEKRSGFRTTTPCSSSTNGIRPSPVSCPEGKAAQTSRIRTTHLLPGITVKTIRPKIPRMVFE